MTHAIAQQELEDEFDGQYGDPRRCPRHPNVHTSSPDGMFDAPCWVCEDEMQDQWEAEEEAAFIGPPVPRTAPAPRTDSPLSDFSDIPF